MATTMLTIGEFSRMTHLSVKALRHYHDVGVLEPAGIDPQSGYRRYGADQVTPAQVIRRLRDLGMPLDGIRSVLRAPDLAARNQEISAHLQRMERQLEQTQVAVSGLRALLGEPGSAPGDRVPYHPGRHRAGDHRGGGGGRRLRLGTGGVRRDRRAGRRHPRPRPGQVRRPARGRPAGALFPGAFFELERSPLTAFRPVPARAARSDAEAGLAGLAGLADPAGGGLGGRGAAGRVRLVELPAIEAAVALHDGPPQDVDRTYGALGTAVAERAIGVDGPMREYYPDGFSAGPHRTEICWPVFRTARA